MNLARRVFRFAGIYGLLVLVPQYFTEVKLGIDYPPAITHPEFYYGFLGVSITWQIAFLFVATDPLRYRPIMIPSILEKATFSIAVILLFLGHSTSGMMLGFALVDLMLGVAFVVAFVRTSSPQAAQAEGLTVRR